MQFCHFRSVLAATSPRNHRISDGESTAEVTRRTTSAKLRGGGDRHFHIARFNFYKTITNDKVVLNMLYIHSRLSCAIENLRITDIVNLSPLKVIQNYLIRIMALMKL